MVDILVMNREWVHALVDDAACSDQVHLPVKILKLLIHELQQHTQQTDPLEVS